MMRSMYTAATGMKSQQLYMDTISNNLSNVNTNSYKKQTVQFKDLMYQTIREPGVRNPEGTVAPAGIQVGLGVQTGSVKKIFTQGSPKETGNNYDMAITGNGFFQVQLPNGAIGYTRDGQFQRGADGTLQTSQGYRLYPEITIPEGFDELAVSEDGYVQATKGTSNEADVVDIGQIDLANFINPSGLKAIGGNVYVETPGAGAPIVSKPGTDGVGRVLHQHLEGSNVEIVDEMIGMISAQRAYEIVSKAITTSENMMQTASGLKR